MGQSAPKGLIKAAEKAAKKAVEQQKPPIPSRSVPPPIPPQQNVEQSNDNSMTPPASAANPGSFLRGDGIAKEDVRDVGQEMYLQHVRKVSEQQQQQQQQQGSEAAAESKDSGAPPVSPSIPSTAASGNDTTSSEMPADLLKFIQDVGPADKQVDKEFTAPRLLKKENVDELEKVESVRKPTRQRRKMPLMGQDDRFTTEKNTYFSYSEDGKTVAAGAKAVPAKEFGLDNMELYELLLPAQTQGASDDGIETIADEFCKSRMTNIEQQGWTDEEIEQHKEWLKRTLQSIEIPTLRMDSDGNMLGLYGEDVPGPEVKSVSVIPETKVMLVLKDLAQSKDTAGLEGSATDKLQERRKERKAMSS